MWHSDLLENLIPDLSCRNSPPAGEFYFVKKELTKQNIDFIFGRYVGFVDAIYEHLAKTYKEKLRLRSYGIPNEKSKVFLEIKKKFKVYF